MIANSNFSGHPRYIVGTMGDLFVMDYRPELTPRGTVLFFPAFGEEMNRTRRMTSLQAKRMARSGYRVIVPDFYGTGDSTGGFQQASWRTWKCDLEAVVTECDVDTQRPVWFWGMRLGSLMTLDSELQKTIQPEGVILWSPVLDGKQFVGQLLRMRVMANMLAGSVESETVATLRQSLQSGMTIEVGGYELNPVLIGEIEDLALDVLLQANRSESPLHWFEMVSSMEAQVSPAVKRTIEKHHPYAKLHRVVGPDFWSTAEISTSKELIDNTIGIMCS